MDELVERQRIQDIIKEAKEAKKKLASYSEKEIDLLISAMAREIKDASDKLARLTIAETGIGRLESKREKNIFVATHVYSEISKVKTCGILCYDKQANVYEIAEPVGLILAFVPFLDPSAVALFVSLISLKARNPVIFVPPRGGEKSTKETVGILKNVLLKKRAPLGCLSCLSQMNSASTLASLKEIDFILASVPPSLATILSSSGKPNICVSPGYPIAYIDRTADIPYTVECIVKSQMFDWGLGPGAEEALVVDQAIAPKILQEFQKQKGYILSAKKIEEINEFSEKSIETVGQPAYYIAEKFGFQVPKDTSVLIAPVEDIESYKIQPRFAPFLLFYVEKGWEAACQRCLKILKMVGRGHELVIHARDKEIVMEFALQKPVSRILVNTPASQGAIGWNTGLTPSLILGSGTQAGEISSDNISVSHLFQRKRVTAIDKNFSLWESPKDITPLSQLNLEDSFVFQEGFLENSKISNATEARKIWENVTQKIPSLPRKISPWKISSYPPPNLPIFSSSTKWPHSHS